MMQIREKQGPHHRRKLAVVHCDSQQCRRQFSQ